MKTLKITRGQFSRLGNGVIKEMGGEGFSWICPNVTDAFDDNPQDNKGKHNAEFIAEAFNVANETGLTPRELLEKSNSLERSLLDTANLLGKALNALELAETYLEDSAPNSGLRVIQNFMKEVKKPTK